MSDTLGAVDIREILRLLPHRYPFVMVDRLIDMRADEHAIGIKNVTFNEPQFMGHFPDNPVMPGVLVIEGMAQTAGTLVLWHLGDGGAGPKSVSAHHRQGEIPQARDTGRHNRISRRQDRPPPQHVVVSREALVE